MHQSGHPLLKFSHQLQKSNAIRYTINFLHSCLGVDYVNVIKGASNVDELLLLFEQAVETSRPDSSVLLERGGTWVTVHSVAQERDMLAEHGINPLFQPPYSTHLNTCGLCFRQMKAFFTEIKLWQKYPFQRPTIFSSEILERAYGTENREGIYWPPLKYFNQCSLVRICDSSRHGAKLSPILQNSNRTQGGS